MLNHSHRPILPLLVAIACGVIWSVAAFLAPHTGTPWADEVQYHLPTIRQFAEKFPRLNLVHYNAATTPGYHIVLAALLKITGSEASLRIANAMMSAGCLLVAMWACRVHLKWGWVWALPLLASPYFHYSALWLRPDNASWMLVFAILGLTSADRFPMRKMLVGAAVLVLLVIFRHVHIWAAAVLWAGAYLSSDTSWRPTRRNVRQLAMMVALTLPAFVIVGYFVSIWHGLVPPAFQTVEGALPTGHSTWQHEGPNWAVPMFIMALMGLVALLFLPLLLRQLRPLSQASGAVLLGMATVLPMALLTPSNWDETRGRRSGLWNIAQQMPSPMDRSILLVPLALIGGGLLAWILVSLPRRERALLLITLLAFVAAQTANAMAWQKYYEPFVVGLMGVISAWLWKPTTRDS